MTVTPSWNRSTSAAGAVARLFITPNTVKYHLGKVFIRLGITTRGQLHRAFPPP